MFIISCFATLVSAGIITQNDAGSITDYFSAINKPVKIVIRNATPDAMFAYVNNSEGESIKVPLEFKKVFNQDRYEGIFYLYNIDRYSINNPKIHLENGDKATVYFVSNNITIFKKIIAEYDVPESVSLSLNADNDTRTVNLSWTASDDEISGVQNYKIFKSTEEEITSTTKHNSKTTVIQTSNTEYSDKNVTSGRTTYYSVVAVDYAGNEAEVSNNKDIYFLDTEAPTIPIFKVSHDVNGVNKIEWEVRDNNQLKRYDFFRNDELLKTQYLSKEQSANYYRDIQPKNGVDYVYKIKVYDAAGNVAEKSGSILTDSKAPELLTDTRISNNINRLNIATDEFAECEYRDITEKIFYDMKGDGFNHWTSVDVDKGQKKKFGVICVDKHGKSMSKEQVILFTYDVTPPPKVNFWLSNDIAKGTDEVILEWSPAEDSKEGSHYEIYRSTAKDAVLSNESLIGETDKVIFRDADIDFDIEYYYSVIAVDTAGNRGPASNPLRVKVPDSVVNFHIIQPKNNEIIVGDKLTIFGKTDPEAIVKVFIDQDTYTIGADSDGKFSLLVSLKKGKNNLVFSITDQYFNTLVKTIGVFMFLDAKKANDASLITGAAIIDPVITNKSVTTSDITTLEDEELNVANDEGFNWTWIILAVFAGVLLLYVTNPPKEKNKPSEHKVNKKLFDNLKKKSQENFEGKKGWNRDTGMDDYISKRRSNK